MKKIDRALNPEQPGSSSWIRLEAVCLLTFCADFFFHSYSEWIACSLSQLDIYPERFFLGPLEGWQPPVEELGGAKGGRRKNDSVASGSQKSSDVMPQCILLPLHE